MRHGIEIERACEKLRDQARKLKIKNPEARARTGELAALAKDLMEEVKDYRKGTQKRAQKMKGNLLAALGCIDLAVTRFDDEQRIKLRKQERERREAAAARERKEGAAKRKEVKHAEQEEDSKEEGETGEAR
ncbi:MAG: hypothetical protein ACYTEQ_03345 [Planctomycetota bacterium]|jgi:hypothetical protein